MKTCIRYALVGVVLSVGLAKAVLLPDNQREREKVEAMYKKFGVLIEQGEGNLVPEPDQIKLDAAKKALVDHYKIRLTNACMVMIFVTGAVTTISSYFATK